MAISGLTPTTALPFATGNPYAGSTALSAPLPGSPLLAANAGAVEKPGLGTRLMNAMRSAISELRGAPTSFGAAQTLAMQSQALPTASQPVSVARPASSAKPKFPNAKTWIDKQGNVRELGTGKVLKAASGAAAAPSPAAAQLPTNATQVPGATVYSYDQNGNPVAPTMQQLGMTPTMLQGLTGMANGVDPDGPQLNATNQTNLSGLASGLGMGSTVPMLGQPIVTTAPTPASAGAATGGNQSVTNENVSDIASRNQGLDYGWGSGGWGLPFGGVATPAAPYGASMTGAYALGNANRWF